MLYSWRCLLTRSDVLDLLDQAMAEVAVGLGGMVALPVAHAQSILQVYPYADVLRLWGSPAAETVAVYAQIRTGLTGHALLLLPLAPALALTARLVEQPPGNGPILGEMEKSALGEVGNVAVSYFLSALMTLTECPDTLWPTPPAVMIDMAGAILETVLVPLAACAEEVLLIATEFTVGEEGLRIAFWVLPDADSAVPGGAAGGDEGGV